SISARRSADHSHQHSRRSLPSRPACRNLVKTSPFISGDGGVPSSQICGFGRADVVGRIADHVPSESSCASSKNKQSAEKPRPELFERARKRSVCPVFSCRYSRFSAVPICLTRLRKSS